MDYKKETVEILQKINDDSLLEFFYRFIARVIKIEDINMDYKKKLIEMLEKADYDQTYTIFRFVCSFLGIK